jgi:hypothetical protein
MNKIPEKVINELNEKISILETLEEYFLEALQIKQIDIKTYYRLTATIRRMVVSFKLKQRLEKASNEYKISFESLNEIQGMAKPYEADTYNIEVKMCLDIVERMLTEYLNSVMKRKEHEVIVQDIDKLLAAVDKVNKMLGF